MSNYTFMFSIDPELNDGITEVFNQCGEPWWWAVKGDTLAAGGIEDLDLTGAKFTGLYVGNKLLIKGE